ncbi:MAG TPA: monovalent cation/H(+) antiporter subunit G [Xanthobacteraceae bacterium]|nr:monovalent cation/H(+) antiporter subunit G [Xanthobacteraceae bacterium]
MNVAPELPLWAAILVSALVLAGAAVTLVGAVGLLRFSNFYARVHAPSLGAVPGTALVLLGSMLCFTVLASRPVLHEVLIFLCLLVTMPLTVMLLARAAYYRDHPEDEAPPR